MQHPSRSPVLVLWNSPQRGFQTHLIHIPEGAGALKLVPSLGAVSYTTLAWCYISILKISIAKLFWSRPTIICVYCLPLLSSLHTSNALQWNILGVPNYMYHKSERIVTHSLTGIFVFLFDIVWVNYHKHTLGLSYLASGKTWNKGTTSLRYVK